MEIGFLFTILATLSLQLPSLSLTRCGCVGLIARLDFAAAVPVSERSPAGKVYNRCFGYLRDEWYELAVYLSLVFFWGGRGVKSAANFVATPAS